VTAAGPTWGRAADVLWRKVPGGAIVLSPARDQPTLLAGSGEALWDALAQPAPVADLVSVLAGRYGVEPAAVRDDVRAALEQLRALGLAEVST
jgi:hypothetical protein